MKYRKLIEDARWQKIQSHWDGLGFLIENPASSGHLSWDLLRLVFDQQLLSLNTLVAFDILEPQEAKVILDLCALRFEQVLEHLNLYRQVQQGIQHGRDFREKSYHRYHALSEMEYHLKCDFPYSLSPLEIQKILEDSQLEILEIYVERFGKNIKPWSLLLSCLSALSALDKDLKVSWEAFELDIQTQSPADLAKATLKQANFSRSKVSALSILAYLDLIGDNLNGLYQILEDHGAPFYLKERTLSLMPLSSRKEIESYQTLLSQKSQRDVHRTLLQNLLKVPSLDPNTLVPIIQNGLNIMSWDTQTQLLGYKLLVKLEVFQDFESVVMAFQVALDKRDYSLAEQALETLLLYGNSACVSYLKSALHKLSTPDTTLEHLQEAFKKESDELFTQIESALKKF